MDKDKIAALEAELKYIDDAAGIREKLISRKYPAIIEAARAHLEQLRRGDTEILEAAIDRMGWPEINAFRAELNKGQDIYEDAGGFFIRCLKALFGIQPRDPVVTYQEAARAMVKKAQEQ